MYRVFYCIVPFLSIPCGALSVPPNGSSALSPLIDLAFRISKDPEPCWMASKSSTRPLHLAQVSNTIAALMPSERFVRVMTTYPFTLAGEVQDFTHTVFHGGGSAKTVSVHSTLSAEPQSFQKKRLGRTSPGLPGTLLRSMNECVRSESYRWGQD